MANLSDVRVALANLVASAVYPNGTSNPSVANMDVIVAPGWPLPRYLDQIFTTVASGYPKAHVSIYEPAGMETNVTRFFPVRTLLTSNPAQLTLTVSGNTITVGGLVNAGEIAVVIVNKATDSPYDYTIISGDTLTTIAANLSANIPGSSVIGLVITLSSAWNINARISTQVQTTQELKRQKKVFWLINWSPTIAARDAITGAIDIVIPENPYIPLPNGGRGRLLYQSLSPIDSMAKEKFYRDDFHVTVEWETNKVETFNTLENISTPIAVVDSL